MFVKKKNLVDFEWFLNPQPRWFVDDTTPLDYLNIKRKNCQNNKKLEILLKQYNGKKLQV